MRTGLAVSVLSHIAILTWGLISLPAPEPVDVSQLEAMPVDFVPIDEATRLNLGLATAQPSKEQTPPPPAPEPPRPSPPPPPPPEPTPPEPEPEPTPEPAPQPQPEPPPPEPPPPEPAPEPEPAPAPTPEPPPEPKPEPPPPPPKEAAKPPTPTPIPRPRPAPPRPAVAKEEKKETLNTDDIAALLDKSKPTGSTRSQEPAPQQPPTLGGQTDARVDQMMLSELDALRARLAQCWNIQLAPPDPSDLRVRVKMFLNPDGTLNQPPMIVEARPNEFGRSAAESAVRAVRRCAPYTLPAEKYDTWREIIVTFDPREMFGG